jgi:hypothetical protein|tara:strand:- start:170 stop:727 length:558 start_codon:yes stop_codon:yes gene_type:complete
MSVIQDNSITSNNIQPASGQALTIKDEGGTASITVATNGEATFAENIIIGTAGKGIDFSNQTDSTSYTPSSEILDHYEEGVWSPGGTNVAGNSTGSYTKIGNVVHISGYVETTGSANSFTGLPFTANSNSKLVGGGITNDQNQSSDKQFGVQPSAGNTTFILLNSSSTVTITSGNRFYFFATYFI